jgi:dipeptide/tripeptide permease
MEVFERMAWYGFYALVSLYITGSRESGGLGFSDADRGFITGVVPFLLYLLPVLTGGLADKFGFKRTFLVAFLVMAPAYLVLGEVRSFWPFFFAFLAVALGAALFKPLVIGTVARVTTSETKAMGFGIFYMIVNVGGFLGPLVASVVRGWGWRWVFVASSLWVVANLPLLLLYDEPPRVADDPAAETVGERLRRVWRDVTTVLGNTRFFVFVVGVLVALMLAGGGKISWAWSLGFVAAWTVVNVGLDLGLGGYRRRPPPAGAGSERFWAPMRLGDWRFGLYLLIVAGFWTEFNQLFLTMPLYIRDYVDTAVLQEDLHAVLAAVPVVGGDLAGAWRWALGYLTENGQIKPENLVNLDSLSIIFLQIAVTVVFARRKPLATMILGCLLTGVAMAMGIWASAGWICVLAIFVFSLGEMTTSPKSEEYVARIAPPGKEAMYMGYYFVSVALGNLFGGLLSGQAYGAFANLETGNGHPEVMWMIFAAIAAATAAVLFVFDRYVVRPTSPNP